MKIAVTGAAGFIGSCLVGQLNRLGYTQLILVDQFDNPLKQKNLENKKYDCLVDRSLFPNNLLHDKPDVIFHIGARTDTTEMRRDIFDTLNVRYSKMLWTYCVEKNIPFIYASSAATYGDGFFGFDDRENIDQLLPMNPYGDSKQEFDIWALAQKEQPPHWHGFKFFNVYGPNEYHKGRMASVVFHAFNQINQMGKIKLFQSHKPDIAHGDQKRDFIYVKDLIDVLLFAWQSKPENGIYNLGTGEARTFNDLANALFHALDKTPSIEYVPTPEDIRDTYQYYTQATMQKLRAQGYSSEFNSLEKGVHDYVTQYLAPNKYL